MRGLLKRLITEPGADSAEDYARRVQILAATYAVLFCASVAGVVVLAIYGKLFVTLAQRSNVETLTILFLLVLYAYLAAISVRGPVDEATIRNAGWGEGVIQVDFRLRPRGGGAPLLRSEKATLRPRETARVEVRVDGARGDEQLDVGLDYPPR